MAKKANTKIVKRLREEMGKAGINARALAEKANVGRSFVYDILNGKSENPTTTKLAAIADALGINMIYLLENTSPKESRRIGPAGPQPSIIPVLDTEGSKSGTTVVTRDSDKNIDLYFNTNWIQKELGIIPKNLRQITLSGDDMSPTLSKGDNVLVDTSKTSIAPPGIFAIFDGSDLLIKRLEKISGKKNFVNVISDNNNYSNYQLKISSIEIIGRVVWHGRKI